jgi:hypothetical protein
MAKRQASGQHMPAYLPRSVVSILSEYDFHPICEAFPWLPEDELVGLADDIEKHGLREAITRYQGQILDGRNRLAACLMSGVKPRFVDWRDKDGSPVALVISNNIARRHLTASQRAVIANDMLPLLEKEAKERQREGARLAKKGATLSITGKASEFAAEAVAVNPRYVEQCKSIQGQAPELIESIRHGTLTIPDASTLARLPKPYRNKILHRVEEQPRRKVAEIVEELVGKTTTSRPSKFVFNGGNLRNPRQNTIATPPGICQFLHDLIAPHYKVETILDPCAGAGALTRPWKGAKVITYEIAEGKDFFGCPDRIDCNLVPCNPPFNNSNGESRFLPQSFLERIIAVVPAGTPIILFAPMAMRLDQTTRSGRWRWMRDHCPPISSIITLPHDAFGGSVKVHSEILLFNMPKLEPHYFLPDRYLE